MLKGLTILFFTAPSRVFKDRSITLACIVVVVVFVFVVVVVVVVVVVPSSSSSFHETV